MLKFTILGDPISQARHRSRVLPNGGLQSYDPLQQQKKGIANVLLAQLIEQRNSQNPEIKLEASNLLLGEFYELDISMYQPISVSWPKSKQNRILWHLETLPSSKDLDNLAKFYLDCANGILFPDDHLITKLTVSKTYSLNPRTEIKIMAKKNTKSDLQQLLELFNPVEMDDIINILDSIAHHYNLYSSSESDEERMSHLLPIHENLKELVINNSPKIKKILAIYNKKCNHEDEINTGDFRGPIC